MNGKLPHWQLITDNRKRMNLRCLFITLCAALTGCPDAVTDAQWAKTVPGIYDGSQSGVRKTVDLRPDGSFPHNASIEGKSLVAESGKGSYNVASGMVSLEPFTSFWDTKSNKLTMNGIPWSVGALGVLRYGHAAERISPLSIVSINCSGRRTVKPHETVG